MLTLIPNENRSAIQLLFTDYFTSEKQFITAFDLNDAMSIGKDLINMVKEIQKQKKEEKNG